jgi:RNA ligase (TIGR02306 family)
MRKLASIQKVLEINPIKGADKIEVAKILGWEVVIKKGEFTVGDYVIYLEIDSLLPRMPWNQFLFKDDTKDTYRLKTVKLRAQISQGLLLPISVLSQYENPPSIEEGLEVTELLKITKYEPSIPAELHGLIKGQFPSRIPKTDEPRIQNFPNIVTECYGVEMVGTSKLDGTSVTFYLIDGVFGVCSRNLDLKPTEGNTYWKMALKYDVENKMRQVQETIVSSTSEFANFSCAGEIFGEGIQGNPMGIKGQELNLFSLYDIDNAKYKSHEVLKHFSALTGIPMVPVVIETIFGDTFTAKYLLEFADKLNYPNGSPMEGIVWRPKNKEMYSEILKGRLSFKTISNSFLLKNGN